jgi:hypothetical protein
MAATIEIDESNGVTETVTHGISNTNYGSVDSPGLDAQANPIDTGTNSFEKWQRWHVVLLGGSSAIQGFKFYTTTAPAPATTHNFNGSTLQATYNAANHKQTVFAQPATTATRTPESVTTSPPVSANIGIGGSLTGSITVDNQQSDYLLSQVRVGASATSGAIMTAVYGYDEVL